MKCLLLLAAFCLASCLKDPCIGKTVGSCPGGFPDSLYMPVGPPCIPPSDAIENLAYQWAAAHDYLNFAPDCQYVQMGNNEPFPYNTPDSAAFRDSVVIPLYNTIRKYIHYNDVELWLVFKDSNVIPFYFTE